MTLLRTFRSLGALLVAMGLTAPAHGLGDEPVPELLGPEAPDVIEERPDPTPWPRHEALSPPDSVIQRNEGDAERHPKPPPAAIAERPGTGPAKPGARWVGGYWAWDKVRADFVWVTGLWHVPPPGKFWVEGYWRRDRQGWYRVPGFWSARVDEERPIDWKKDGPPNPPDEDVPPAPGPNHFYVAGVYTPDPDGKGLVWKAGYWYKAQPGWEWLPTRWIRRSSGWVFREGSWQRAQPSEAAPTDGEAAMQPSQAVAVPPGYPTVGPSRTGRFNNRVLP